MGKINAIANQKVGVGKTTTAIKLAAALAVLDKKVLLIDVDPQANATSGVGIRPDDIQYTSYECIVDGVDPHKAILQTTTPHLDIIPSSIDLVGAELELVNVHRREFVMREVFRPLANEYDFIFFRINYYKCTDC